MSRTICLPETHPGHAVWAALSRYTVGPDSAALPFADRLARENGWSADHARRVIEEYKRFCLLAVISAEEMTPSDAVDQAWHLHLTCTRDYWERFCPEVLGRALHHGPTAGGSEERHRFFEQYAQTLKSYEQVFGSLPPADIWPNAAQRLVEDPKARRVHPRDAIVIPRTWSRPLLVLAATVAFAHILFW